MVDISSPASPVMVGGVGTAGAGLAGAVAGNHAYVADGHGLRLMDISPPHLVALVAQGLLFGAVHAYNRGLYGFVVIGAVGIGIGFCYVAFKRNLTPVILAHGMRDMVGFLGRFAG